MNSEGSCWNNEKRGEMLAANKTMIFKYMDHLKILLTEIVKIFLCNIQINEEIVHMVVENFMILGYNIDEKNIKHINLMATMFSLQNTAETPAHLSADLDLSDSEEDEKPVEPPPSFLAANSDPFDLDGVVNSFNDDENTSPFEIGTEKDDSIKDFLMTNLKKEVPNKEKVFLSQETMKTEKKKVVTNIHLDVVGGKERKQMKMMKMRRKKENEERRY